MCVKMVCHIVPHSTPSTEGIFTRDRESNVFHNLFPDSAVKASSLSDHQLSSESLAAIRCRRETSYNKWMALPEIDKPMTSQSPSTTYRQKSKFCAQSLSEITCSQLGSCRLKRTAKLCAAAVQNVPGIA